jgi:hypothetical protein
MKGQARCARAIIGAAPRPHQVAPPLDSAGGIAPWTPAGALAPGPRPVALTGLHVPDRRFRGAKTPAW